MAFPSGKNLSVGQARWAVCREAELESPGSKLDCEGGKSPKAREVVGAEDANSQASAGLTRHLQHVESFGLRDGALCGRNMVEFMPTGSPVRFSGVDDHCLSELGLSMSKAQPPAHAPTVLIHGLQRAGAGAGTCRIPSINRAGLSVSEELQDLAS